MSMDINKDKNTENMELWNSVCITPIEWAKDVNVGNRTITSPCAYKRIERATELWGPFGKKWGVKNERFNIIANLVSYYQATLYYPDGEMPIHSDVKIYFKSGSYNEDWTKKNATDALTKGLSKIGMCADIFQNQFKAGNPDDNKYIAISNYKKDAENKRKKGFKTLNIDQITEIKDIIKTKNIPINNFFNRINSGGTKFNKFESIPDDWYNPIIAILNKMDKK